MKAVNIISLGAGVQSSAMSVMLANGDLATPDGNPVAAAVFADTGDEPDEVYEYLEYMKTISPWPVYVEQYGVISEDFLAALAGRSNRAAQPPYFVKNRAANADDAGGQLWRKCTTDYKIGVLKRKSRAIMKEAGASRVNQLIGISLDEYTRMKDSRVKYVSNNYPLVWARLSRWDCLRYMEKHGHPEPPKSACWHCPYHSNSQWRRIKQDPKLWAKVVAYEKQLIEATSKPVKSNGANITGTVYLHRSCVPIDQVDLSTEEDAGQLDMFQNECEGMCGL